MKLSLGLLLRFIEFHENVTLADVVSTLSKIGVEVDDVQCVRRYPKTWPIARSYENSLTCDHFEIVTISSITQHPNADRLSICKFIETENVVVCGAPNIYLGMRTILARPNAEVLDRKGCIYQIEITKIRGVSSDGMLCSESELGLFTAEDNKDGIIDLHHSETSLDAILNPNKAILNLSITPNRVDLHSVYGIARELSLFGLGELKSFSRSDDMKFRIKNLDSCESCIFGLSITFKDFYVDRFIREQVYLSKSSTINDDNTYLAQYAEYIQIIFGFKIKIKQISNVEYAVYIKDNFPSVNPNRYLRSLKDILSGVSSDLSIRESGSIDDFSFNTDNADNTDLSRYGYTHGLCRNIFGLKSRYDYLQCAGFMIEDMKNCSDIHPGALSVHCAKDNACYSDSNLDFTTDYQSLWSDLNQDCIMLIDTPYDECDEIGLSNAQVDRILFSLGFSVNKQEKCIPPFWRTDIIDRYNVFSEVVRYIGIDSINDVPIVINQNSDHTRHSIDDVLSYLKTIGGFEVVNDDFISKDMASIAGSLIEIQNPISKSKSHIRNCILISLLNTYAEHRRYNWQSKMIFEHGLIFDLEKFNDPKTTSCHRIAIAFNPDIQDWFDKNNKYPSSEYLEAKRTFERSLSVLYKNFTFSTQMFSNSLLSEGCSYKISSNQTHGFGSDLVAWFGFVRQEFLRKIKCKSTCYAGEIIVPHCDKIKDVSNVTKSLHKVLTKDVSFTVPAGINIDKAMRDVYDTRPFNTDLRLIDVYPNCDLSHSKTLTVRIIWDQLEKVMTSDQINICLDQVYNALTGLGYQCK